MDELYQDDQDFMEVLKRNERTELCAYRTYVLDEIRSREDGTKTQLIIDRQEELRSKLWDASQAAIFFAFTLISVFIVVVFAYNRSTTLALLFVGLATGSATVGAVYAMNLRKTLHTQALVMKSYDERGETEHRSIISTDPDKILNAKKAKLDQMLGFATKGPQ